MEIKIETLNRALMHLSCHFKKLSSMNLVSYNKLQIDSKMIFTLFIANPEIFFFRGKTLMASGYFMEALMDFSVAILLTKRPPPPLISSGIKQENVSSSKQAKKDLQMYYCHAGQANYELAQFEEALQHFTMAISEGRPGLDSLSQAELRIQ